MKIIFLDIDGVLNFTGCKDKIGGIYFVNDEKIKILKEIIDKTGAKVVLSSTWKSGWWDLEAGIDSIDSRDFIALRNKLLEFGIELYDKTRDCSHYRGDEIKNWLSTKDNIDNILILDDDSDISPYSKFFLKTSFREGLKQNHIKHAINILEGNKYKDWLEKQKTQITGEER